MKSHFGASQTLGLDSLALWQQWWRCHDTYDINNIWRLEYNIYDISCQNIASNISLMEFGNLNGLQLKFGEGGRLGKGGHMANHEHTP